MNRNLIIVLAGGFLIAVLVAFLVQASLSGKKKDEPLKEEPRVQIVVASKDMKVGEELSAENIKWQEWPANAVFPGAVVRKEKKSPEDMISGRLLRSVKEGEPIVETALVAESKGNFVAATLDEGMRAVAIEVNASRMVAGFVGPGDYVDVLLTYKGSVKYNGPENQQIDDFIELNLDQYSTETILQNVKVLAVDQAARRDEEKDAVKVGKTVTLEVDLREAEMLAVAAEMGTLSLALRRLGDEKIYQRDYDVVTDKRITNITDEIYAAILRIQNSSGQNANIVRIYNGYGLVETPVRP